MNWSMNGHDRRHWKALSSTYHYLQAISRNWLHRHWQKHGRHDKKWDYADIGSFAHSIFPDFRHWLDGQKEERSFICTVSKVLSGNCSVRSHLGRFWIVEDLMCVCAGDYETPWFGTVKDSGWKVIVSFMRMSIEIPICELCALYKWCAVKCCLDFLRGFGVKLWWFGPSPVFEGLEMYSLGPEIARSVVQLDFSSS
jgi:hypothetical protein